MGPIVLGVVIGLIDYVVIKMFGVTAGITLLAVILVLCILASL